MKQYCRYCAYLTTGNGIYCGAKDRILSEQTTKRVNTCRQFEFNEIDAYDLERKYKPRRSKTIEGQLSMFFGGMNNDGKDK